MLISSNHSCNFYLYCLLYSVAPDDSGPRNEKTKNMALVVGITALVSVVLVLGAVASYKFWQRRKRLQEQARFLRLFEEDDEIADELGIGPLTHVI